MFRPCSSSGVPPPAHIPTRRSYSCLQVGSGGVRPQGVSPGAAGAMPTEIERLTKALKAAKERVARRARAVEATPPATRALACLLALLCGGNATIAGQWLADTNRRRLQLEHPSSFYAPRVLAWVEELSAADRAAVLAGDGRAGQWRLKRARDVLRRYRAVTWIVDANTHSGAAPSGEHAYFAANATLPPGPPTEPPAVGGPAASRRRNSRHSSCRLMWAR